MKKYFFELIDLLNDTRRKNIIISIRCEIISGLELSSERAQFCDAGWCFANKVNYSLILMWIKTVWARSPCEKTLIVSLTDLTPLRRYRVWAIPALRASGARVRALVLILPSGLFCGKHNEGSVSVSLQNGKKPRYILCARMGSGRKI